MLRLQDLSQGQCHKEQKYTQQNITTPEPIELDITKAGQS
jgi:hypothetical protein